MQPLHKKILQPLFFLKLYQYFWKQQFDTFDNQCDVLRAAFCDSRDVFWWLRTSKENEAQCTCSLWYKPDTVNISVYCVQFALWQMTSFQCFVQSSVFGLGLSESGSGPEHSLSSLVSMVWSYQGAAREPGSSFKGVICVTVLLLVTISPGFVSVQCTNTCRACAYLYSCIQLGPHV